jgi:hypothetical protein
VQDVEPTELPDGHLHERVHLGRVRDIGGDGHGSLATTGDGRGDPISTGAVDVGDHHARPLSGQQLGARSPDPRRRPGDDGDLAGNPIRHFRNPPIPRLPGCEMQGNITKRLLLCQILPI